MRTLAAYVLRGPWQATGVLTLFAALGWLLPPVALISNAALTLVVLARGGGNGMRVMSGATLWLALFGLLGLGSVRLAMGQMLAIWIPVFAATAVLQASRSLGAVVGAAVLLSSLFAWTVRLATQDAEVWWRGLTAAVVRKAGAGLAEGLDVTLLDAMVPYMNGFAAAGVACFIAGSVFLGRWWQSQLDASHGIDANTAGSGLSFAREFQNLRWSPVVAAVFLAVGTLIAVVQHDALVGGFAVDVFVLLMTGYMFQGLSLVHYHSAHGGSGMWLAAVYGGLLILTPHTLVTLSAVGLTDSLLDYRRLWRKQTNS